MSRRSWKESHWKGTWLELLQCKEKDEGTGEDKESQQRVTLKERIPWLKPTGSSASDETEEVKPLSPYWA